MSDFGMGYAMGRDGNYGGGYGCGYGGFGGDWIAIFVILAILGGNNGWGFGGNGGNNMLGYELGKAATQADVASGFTTSEIMSDLNDILMGQTQGFAGVQQTLCQGFNGINTSIMQEGFRNQAGFNAVERQIADCCCRLENAYQAGTQRLLDYAHNKENQELRDRLFKSDLRQSLQEQSAYLTDQIIPRSRPAYPGCNPFESAWGWTSNRNNSCCNNCY